MTSLKDGLKDTYARYIENHNIVIKPQFSNNGNYKDN